MRDAAVSNGHDGTNLFQGLIGYGEVIVAKHGEIREFSGLDRAQLILFAQKPAVAGRVQLENFLARDPLSCVDHDLSCIETRRRVIHVQPRIHRCDLHAVRTHAGVDAIIHDHPEWRAILLGSAREVSPGRQRQTSTHLSILKTSSAL